MVRTDLFRPACVHKYHQYPLAIPDISDTCYIYDLDGTLVFPGLQTDDQFSFNNIKSQRKLLCLSDIQPPQTIGIVLTFRPSCFRAETIAQLELFRPRLHTVFMRNEKLYPFNEPEAVVDYKLTVLEHLLHTYKAAYFFEDTLAVCEAVLKFNKKLRVFHVQALEDPFCGHVGIPTEIGVSHV